MGDWVAIVDSDVANLTVTSHILYRENMKVSAFKSGRDLLTFLNHNRPDLVLLNVHMTEPDGFAILQAIRARDEVKDLPVIFFVDGHDEKAVARGVAEGAADFIMKPFVPETLLLRVWRSIEFSRLRNRLDEEVEKRTKDILNRREHIRMLSSESETDQVTGLLDKASAQAAIGELCKEAQGVMLLIDIDSFKLVNDIYGRNAGDIILARAAGIIRSAVRMNDLVGRVGDQ